MIIAAIAVVAVVIWLDRGGFLLANRNDDYRTFHEIEVEVVRVIDGDTLDIKWPDPTTGRPITRVRLWGIDAPEVGNSTQQPEPFALESKMFAESLVQSGKVVLRLEDHRPRGKYDRVLAHVDLPTGKSLNRQLLLAGMASADDRWPHSRLISYQQAELAALRAKVGIWNETALSDK